jgi:DNA-binding ferritin-like protein
MSNDIHDEDSNALMGDYIRIQEELTWMYSSFMAGKQA